MQGDARRWRRKREADNGIFALLALSLEACVVPNDIADPLLLASMAITMLLRSDALRAEFDGVVAVALGHLGSRSEAARGCCSEPYEHLHGQPHAACSAAAAR